MLFNLTSSTDICRRMTPSTKFLIAIVFPSLVLSVVNAFEVTDCSGKDALAKLDKVTIGGCPVGTPDKYCPMARGQTASIDIDFESETTLNKAIVEVYGKIAFVPIPFNLTPNDACGNYGFDCPVGPHEKKSLKISLPILKQYPALYVTVQLRMLNENKRPIVCVEFPARIVSA